MKTRGTLCLAAVAAMSISTAAADEIIQLSLQSAQFTFNAPIVKTKRVNTFSTEILGKFNAGTVFDQTFNDKFHSPVVRDGVRSARAAITAAGGPGILISKPVLTAHAVTVQSSTSASIFSLDRTIKTVTQQVHIGPTGFILDFYFEDTPTFDPKTGLQNPLCSDEIAALPSSTRPSCPLHVHHSLIQIPEGVTHITTNTDYNYVIDETQTVTNTYLIFKQFTLTGTVQEVGKVHNECQKQAFDLSARFLRRFKDHERAGNRGRRDADLHATDSYDWAAGPVEVWGETYTVDADRGAADLRSGARRQSSGMSGGFSLALNRSVTFGFAFDDGQSDMALSETSEAAGLTLTQLGAGLSVTTGRFQTTVSTSYGSGHVDAAHGDDLLGGVSAAAYGVRLMGVLAETVLPFDAAGWTLRPNAGFEWLRYESDAFSETGGFALAAPRHGAERARLLMGIDAGRSVATRLGSVDLTVSAKAVDMIAGRVQRLPTAFAALPDVPLVITGDRATEFGAELGASASLAIADTTELALAYEGTFQGHASDTIASLSLKLHW